MGGFSKSSPCALMCCLWQQRFVASDADHIPIAITCDTDRMALNGDGIAFLIYF